MSYVRLCPRCGGARPAEEIVCQSPFQGRPCHWSLFEVLPVPADSLTGREVPGTTAVPPASVRGEGPASATPDRGLFDPPAGARCLNGHPLEPGDFFCMVCGEAPAPVRANPAPTAGATAGAAVTDSGPDDLGISDVGNGERVIGGWRLSDPLRPGSDGIAELFQAVKADAPGAATAPVTAVFKLYRGGVEPAASLYPALRSLDPDHGLRLLDAGRSENRAFEVWEHLPLGSLADVAPEEKAASAFVRQVVREVGAALSGLAGVQVIHRDLKPANVLVRRREPLDLVLSDFSTATFSEFDLQLTTTRQTARYAAPETVAGACSAASDWWSLGVIVLELLTRGQGFEGVHERAFLLHLVTRGLRVPGDLPEEWRELLMGLLTRDPSRRWGWAEVSRWLDGERGIAHGYAGEDPDDGASGRSLRLNGRAWPTPESFALAAAEAAGWDEARDLLLGGRLATWLQERGGERDQARATQVRGLAADLALPEDARLAAALLTLNANLPLCRRGEIITPAWLLAHPEAAVEWLEGPLPTRLRRMEREGWFVRLRERADRVRARVRETGIPCDETQLRAALLSTSRPMLEGRWAERRRVFPEAEHPALASMLERRTPSEEDLIVLVSASPDLFRPVADTLAEAEREAGRAQVALPPEDTQRRLGASRRELLDALDERLRHFVRCGHATADQWADDFRQDRRITLARALVLLAVPADRWREPPRQEYVRNVIDFFHRRLVTGLQRGGLVRMIIGRTTARLDLTELAGPARSAEALLAVVLGRQAQPVGVDPTPLLREPLREQRLRRLGQNAAAYRRDTGINALYLGFPFVTLRDARATEAAKPRIAPVLLWPVRLETPAGQRGIVRLGFDPERDGVRVNPALEGLLGGAAPAWRELLDDVRGQENLDLRAVLDALTPLAPWAVAASAGVAQDERPGPPRLLPLPPATVRVGAGQVQLHAAAVLFQADFSGQTIAEDLKQMATQPIQGTALEVAIRARETPGPGDGAASPPEVDRYFTAASDPSQEAAVFRARQAPGLVVQGPPGTGKSQTIVNIVCDAIGRGERVLVVCQKLAALEVVRKRLEAEGLGERLFLLKNTDSERRPTLSALREQLERPGRAAAQEEQLGREREGLARHIEALEGELDGAHAALRAVRPGQSSGGLTYRELLEALLEVERGARPPVAFAALGAGLRHLDQVAAEQLIAEIAPLTPLWLDARYEASPLHALANFRTDEATAGDFRQALDGLRQAESHRHELLRQHAHFYDFDAPGPLQGWLTEHETALRALPVTVAQSLSRWAGIFTPTGPGEAPPAEGLLPWLEHLEQSLRPLEGWSLEPILYERLAARGPGPLRQLAADAARLARSPDTFFARLSPGRWRARRRLARWLRAAGVDPEATDHPTLQAAAELELALRDERPALQEWCEALGEEGAAEPWPLPALRVTVRRLQERLQPVVAAARRVLACPVQGAAQALREGGDPQVCGAVLDACRASLALWAATRRSEVCLAAAVPWFEPGWIDARRAALVQRAPGDDSLEALDAALPTLVAFQRFRLRARALTPAAFPLLALLREREETWRRVPSAELPAEITRALRREALLAWKDAAEEACPALLMEREEVADKVRLLGQQDVAMREANRRLLVGGAGRGPVAARGRWDDVVMLQGPRARRLREVVERGEPLGLFQLRPVWMVNPEMASRIFPLRAGWFDLVVFDEASQLPVEAALPALFRARRMVVSGDEKQMPPSRFFGSQLDSDEEEDGAEDWPDADEEGLDDTGRERLAQAAGRREVKDCGDLLTLTQNLLPTATLEIHYRSKYRELINFSNAAFYAGRLNVPARHPAAEVRRARPLEVERVNGTYLDQTNPAEAERIVARLRDLWRVPADRRPSLGVVTFNLKQAELIEEKLEDLAEVDEGFRRAWVAEQARTQRGEDMGFFVKNLENVQGDERDWILFSTTFGRDRAGAFRRNFGVLGQRGGERRLNVAVTRAREKVLLFTSLPVAEISAWAAHAGRRPPVVPRDYLQGWLTYVERLDRGDLDAGEELLGALKSGDPAGIGQPPRHPGGDGPVPTSSPFTDQVAVHLRELGHEPVRATGDAFGVDFALVDPRTGLFGLGIECDPPDHPVLATARARELWRPTVLRTSIPSLHRVSSRAWYHHPAAERERLRAAVESALGPSPVRPPNLNSSP